VLLSAVNEENVFNGKSHSQRLNWGFWVTPHGGGILMKPPKGTYMQTASTDVHDARVSELVEKFIAVPNNFTHMGSRDLLTDLHQIWHIR
jgi:hypothetical protein